MSFEADEDAFQAYARVILDELHKTGDICSVRAHCTRFFGRTFSDSEELIGGFTKEDVHRIWTATAE